MAVASPIPDAAPVMSATLPLKFNVLSIWVPQLTLDGCEPFRAIVIICICLPPRCPVWALARQTNKTKKTVVVMSCFISSRLDTMIRCAIRKLLFGEDDPDTPSTERLG